MGCMPRFPLRVSLPRCEQFIGGEFEQALVDLAEHLEGLSAAPQIHPLDTSVSLARLRFQKPDRAGLPPLRSYAHLVLPDGEHRTVGYTEASRGCKHLCRHCPIVPVYNGVFRIVGREVVLADIRQQVAAARSTSRLAIRISSMELDTPFRLWKRCIANSPRSRMT